MSEQQKSCKHQIGIRRCSRPRRFGLRPAKQRIERQPLALRTRQFCPADAVGRTSPPMPPFHVPRGRGWNNCGHAGVAFQTRVGIPSPPLRLRLSSWQVALVSECCTAACISSNSGATGMRWLALLFWVLATIFGIISIPQASGTSPSDQTSNADTNRGEPSVPPCGAQFDILLTRP
jgi:hypothetical protein